MSVTATLLDEHRDETIQQAETVQKLTKQMDELTKMNNPKGWKIACFISWAIILIPILACGAIAMVAWIYALQHTKNTDAGAPSDTRDKVPDNANNNNNNNGNNNNGGSS